MKELEQLLEAALGADEAGRCDRGVDLCRYVADDLDRAESEAFKHHLEGCCDCQSDLALFSQSASAWRLSDTEAAETAGLWSKLGKWWNAPRLLAALALAVTALVVVLLPTIRDNLGEGELRPKNELMGAHEVRVMVAADRNGHVFSVTSGSQIATGDRFGFFYSSPSPFHLLILHVDETNAVTQIFPAQKPTSVLLPAGVEVRLPDGAQAGPFASTCEWFVALVANETIDSHRAHDAVRTMVANRSDCTLAELRLVGTTALVTGMRR